MMKLYIPCISITAIYQGAVNYHPLMMVINSCNGLALFLRLNNGNVQTSYISSAGQGWVQLHILEINSTTTRPNQIHCFSRFQFKYNYTFSILIQIHRYFLFKCYLNILTFLKFKKKKKKKTCSIHSPFKLHPN